VEPIPTPSILDEQDYFGVRGGRKVWSSRDRQRYYTWDGLHGEVEVFNRRGDHLGALDPHTGELIKSAVKGRKLDV
jgi:hypothetical protein